MTCPMCQRGEPCGNEIMKDENKFTKEEFNRWMECKTCSGYTIIGDWIPDIKKYGHAFTCPELIPSLQAERDKLKDALDFLGAEITDDGSLQYQPNRVEKWRKSVDKEFSQLQAERDKLIFHNSKLKTIAQLTNYYLGIGCCEEHEKANWSKLMKALGEWEDDSFEVLKPSVLKETIEG